MMELFLDLNNKPLVLIRFNPDKYMDEEGDTIRGIFRFNEKNDIFSYKEAYKDRIKKLKKTVDYHLNNIPEKEVNIEYLFYDT